MAAAASGFTAGAEVEDVPFSADFEGVADAVDSSFAFSSALPLVSTV